MSKMKDNKNTDKVMYKKENDLLNIGLEKIDRENIECVTEVENKSSCELITKEQTSLLGIAPLHIRDYEIKKPDEKEPSLLKMITDKIKGNSNSGNSNKQKCKGSDENLNKEKTLQS